MSRTKSNSINGFTSIDLLLGSSLLSTAFALISQFSNPTINTAVNATQNSKINQAIASRIEKIREVSFFHLCEKNKYIDKRDECRSDHIYQQKYDLTSLKKYCKTNTLGSSLLHELESHPSKLTENFNITDYDRTAQSALISTDIVASGNQIKLSFNSGSDVNVSTIIIPHSYIWC
ncbi:hypothetical protein [Synechococcus sp. KORDI-52]|uniref:hypothetical protein n=1 Tax=Synechococcus sp. KORDI-52 TaxID=585425 RepID=UPI0012EB50FB|nr:hypothetical protein [Synechococcus sp. KORDI-52]